MCLTCQLISSRSMKEYTIARVSPQSSQMRISDVWKCFILRLPDVRKAFYNNNQRPIRTNWKFLRGTFSEQIICHSKAFLFAIFIQSNTVYLHVGIFLKKKTTTILCHSLSFVYFDVIRIIHNNIIPCTPCTR